MAKKKQESTGLQKLIEDQLADVYYVEKQLVKALPKMAKKVQNEDLRTALEDHLAETEAQVERVEEMFQAIGMTAKAKKCPGIDGILKEGTEMMEELADDPALDAGILAAAQKVEHYEITTYGSLKAWAEEMEMTELVELIDETLGEEKAADETLSDIAEAVINREAEEEGEEEEEEEGEEAESSNGGAAKKGAAKRARSVA